MRGRLGYREPMPRVTDDDVAHNLATVLHRVEAGE